MKAVFVSYNQALTDPMQEILDDLGVRGFTKWELTMGRGSFDGEPHYGTHAWPSMNSSMLMIVEDEKVAPLLDAFRKLDSQTKMQGSRAFVWNIEQLMRRCAASLRYGGPAHAAVAPPRCGAPRPPPPRRGGPPPGGASPPYVPGENEGCRADDVLRRFGRMACYSKSSVFMIFMIRNWRRSTVSMANNTTDATAPTAAKMKPPVMNFHSVRKMNTTSAIEQSVIRNFRPFITVG